MSLRPGLLTETAPFCLLERLELELRCGLEVPWESAIVFHLGKARMIDTGGYVFLDDKSPLVWAQRHGSVIEGGLQLSPDT